MRCDPPRWAAGRVENVIVSEEKRSKISPGHGPDASATSPERCEPDLRPYQTDLIGRIRAAYAAGHHRVLAVAPTGSGKTI